MMISKLLSIPDGAPPKIERTLFKSQVVDILRSQIILGHLPPGTPLIERELAETLRVSRLPVREALQALEQEGLVSSSSSHRRCVIQLTERDILELYEVRLQLERLAVDRAAQNTSPEHHTQLNCALSAMEHALSNRDEDAFPQTDVDLHRAIWRQADNIHLEHTLQTMSGQLLMFASRHSQMYEWSEVLDLHRDLVQQINAGDSQAAIRSIDAHMQNSLERALRAFQPQQKRKPTPTYTHDEVYRETADH